MTAERDRLAALLEAIDHQTMGFAETYSELADRLIAAGVYVKREPGTYRTPEGGIEVIVDVPESASWVEDEFPDEVAYLRADLDVERLARAVVSPLFDIFGFDERLSDAALLHLAAAIAAAYREDAR